jgi:hypothetical protein
MITWNVTAQFLRHMNIAKVNIPLHSFINGFKIVESKIENDSLVLQFIHKDHYLYKEPDTSKMPPHVKPRHHEIE